MGSWGERITERHEGCHWHPCGCQRWAEDWEAAERRGRAPLKSPVLCWAEGAGHLGARGAHVGCRDAGSLPGLGPLLGFWKWIGCRGASQGMEEKGVMVRHFSGVPAGQPVYGVGQWASVLAAYLQLPLRAAQAGGAFCSGDVQVEVQLYPPCTPPAPVGVHRPTPPSAGRQAP